MRFNIYSARHLSQDICPPISQIVLKNFIKISLIIKECPEEIFIISVILWWSVLLVEETREPGENHRPATSH
jgi:hypothetical protein